MAGIIGDVGRHAHLRLPPPTCNACCAHASPFHRHCAILIPCLRLGLRIGFCRRFCSLSDTIRLDLVVKFDVLRHCFEYLLCDRARTPRCGWPCKQGHSRGKSNCMPITLRHEIAENRGQFVRRRGVTRTKAKSDIGDQLEQTKDWRVGRGQLVKLCKRTAILDLSERGAG